MKKRSTLIALTLLAVVAIVFPMRGAVAGLVPNSQGAEIQQATPLAGMNELLNYPFPVHITEVEDPDERQVILNKLLGITIDFTELEQHSKEIDDLTASLNDLKPQTGKSDELKYIG